MAAVAAAAAGAVTAAPATEAAATANVATANPRTTAPGGGEAQRLRTPEPDAPEANGAGTAAIMGFHAGKGIAGLIFRRAASMEIITARPLTA